MVSRQALADHYFLLGWYVEIAPLALCSHGSLVAMTLDGTCGDSLTLCVVEPLLFSSTLVLTGRGHSSTKWLTQWPCF